MPAIGAIFHEIRRRGQDFVARLDDGAEETHERARRAHRQNDILCRKLRLLLFRQPGGQRGPHFRYAGVGAVPQPERTHGLRGDFPQRVRRLGRRRHVRIPEREIAYGIRTVNLLQFDPLLEHLADPA